MNAGGQVKFVPKVDDSRVRDCLTAKKTECMEMEAHKIVIPNHNVNEYVAGSRSMRELAIGGSLVGGGLAWPLFFVPTELTGFYFLYRGNQIEKKTIAKKAIDDQASAISAAIIARDNGMKCLEDKFFDECLKSLVITCEPEETICVAPHADPAPAARPPQVAKPAPAAPKKPAPKPASTPKPVPTPTASASKPPAVPTAPAAVPTATTTGTESEYDRPPIYRK